MRYLIAALMALTLFTAISAQDGSQAPAPQFGFKAGISLGVDTLPTGASGAMQGWNRLGFQPDLSFGPFGVGLDLSMRFQMGSDFLIYQGDWIPDYQGNGKTIFDIYLPKILYVRYGQKGDPLFAKLGSISDLSLGNGFIMSNYSNMRFLPDQRIFGLDLGLDGALFGMPIAGVELLTGNLAQFDVLGGRLFVRPLVFTGLPILKDAQLGATAVVDTKPNLYTTQAADTVFVYGGDITIPILGGDAFPLAAFADVAVEPQSRTGEMLGFGGRLIKFLTYGAQLRMLQNGFIPSYFDSNYDLYRAAKFAYINTAPTATSYAGWYASLGTSIFPADDKDNTVALDISLDGPFGSSGGTAQTDYPHLRGYFIFDIKALPIFLDASYEKYYIGQSKQFFPDLVDPTNAIIGLGINYRTGASILTLRYDATWDPDTSTYKVKSSIQASVQF